MAISIAVITITGDDGEITVDSVSDPESHAGQVAKVLMEGVALARQMIEQESMKDDTDAV